MSGLIVITRPIDEAEDYAKELHAAGYKTFIEPMLKIEPRDFVLPNLSHYQGVLVTSANAVCHYIQGGGTGGDITVYCVGKHSAAAAKDAGFSDVVSLSGTGANLLNYVLEMPDVDQRKFIHISGAHVAFPLVERLNEKNVSADRLVVYESVQVKRFSDELLAHFAQEKVEAVTFFSKRTAQAFVGCVVESESESRFSSIKSLSISEAVLECVRLLPWKAAHYSATPDRAGIMKLLKAYV